MTALTLPFRPAFAYLFQLAQALKEAVSDNKINTFLTRAPRSIQAIPSLCLKIIK
jgi:hypothetical protein